MFSGRADPAQDSAYTNYQLLSSGVLQAMAHNSKRGFFSSLFGKKKLREEEENAQLESRHKLEERIRQVLAESGEIPKVLMMEHKHTALATLEEEVEAPIELLPISASVLSIRKAPVQPAFVLSAFEVPRPYASNDR
jgi:hypothetical protein